MGLFLSSYLMTEGVERTIYENPNISANNNNYENTPLPDTSSHIVYEYVGKDQEDTNIFIVDDNGWMSDTIFESYSDIVMIHPSAKRNASWVNICTVDSCLQYVEGIHVYVTCTNNTPETFCCTNVNHTINVTSPDFGDDWFCCYIPELLRRIMAEIGVVYSPSRNDILQSLSDAYIEIVMKTIEYVRCHRPSASKQHVYVLFTPLSKGMLGNYEHEHTIMTVESLSAACSREMLSELHEMNISFHMVVPENSAQHYRTIMMNEPVTTHP